MSFRSKAIFNTHSDVVSLDAETDAYDKDGNSITLDESKIKTEESRLQAEWDSQAYARARKAEYDALNQLELMSDDSINGTTTHKDAIVAIKAKWPKDNSGPV